VKVRSQVARLLAGAVALIVGIVLFLHISIVATYGRSGEATAGVVTGALILFALILMWGLGRPENLLGRTGVCLGLGAAYLAVFMLVV
jgi:hypothetical protein